MPTRSSSRKTIQVSAEPERHLVLSYKWAWYAMALFVPLSGLLIGLFLYDQDSRDVRKVGRNCLFIGFIVWVLFPILIMLVVGAFLVAAAANWVADMLPAAD